jgi:uncharacterized membrane protein
MVTKKVTSPKKKTSKQVAVPIKQTSALENTLISGIAYVTVIGWLIAYFSSSESLTDYDRFHIRQAFGVHMTVLFFEILANFSMIPSVLMSVIWLVYSITMVVMMIQAWRGKRTKIALLGDKFQQWFSFL